MNNSKRLRWSRLRHRVTYNLLKLIFKPYTRLKMGYKYQKFDNSKQAYLVLCNHQTFFDQFLVGLALKQYAYFVCSEDLLSMGAVSKAINYLARPIPIVKSRMDLNTIRICRQVVRENRSIVLFPEGNTTYSGSTEYIKPSIAKLIKLLKVPVMIYNLDGGYGIQPRWSDKMRKGAMTGRVALTIMPEQYVDMTDEQLFVLVSKHLYVDNSGFDGRYYKGNNVAQYLERALYYCPNCGIGDMYSKDDTFCCKHCGLTVQYGVDKQFHQVDGGVIPFVNVKQWYDKQSQYVLDLDLDVYLHKPIYSNNASLRQVKILDRKQSVCDNVQIAVYGDRIVAGDICFEFCNIKGMAIQGRNKVLLTTAEDTYQIVGNNRFCGLIYVNVYYSYIAKERNSDVEFLGL